MARQLCLVSCSNFEREVRSISGLPEFRDLVLATLPARCDLVDATWSGLPDLLQKCRTEGQSVCLLGSYCLARAVSTQGPADVCPTAQKSLCSEWIADKDTLDRFLGCESLLVVPGWLKSWEQHLESRWPSNRKDAQAFFRDSAKKIVLLDTGVYPKAQSDLRGFAKFLRLPYETYSVGLGFLRLNLSSLALSRRLEQEREEVEEQMDGVRRLMADYTRLAHLLGSVTNAQNEEEAASAVLDVFRVLLSPEKIAYHPVPSLSHNPSPEDSPQDRILSLNADYAWVDDRTGFHLRVAYGRETLGILEVVGLALPNRKDHDLGLGLALAKVMGLALANARSFRSLQDQQNRAQAAEAALRVSEEKIQSVFSGVPVGLYRTTPSGEIVDANPALARMLGYPDPAALKAVNCWDLHLNRSDRESCLTVLDSSHLIETFETQLRRRDGTLIWVRDTARAVKDQKGQTCFYDGALEDITRRKHTDAVLSWNLQLRTSLADVSARLLSPTSIEEMSGLVLEHVRRLTSSLTCLVGYVDHRNGRLVTAAATDDAREMIVQQPDKASDAHHGSALWNWVLANKKPILTNLPTLDPRFTGLPSWHFPVTQLLIAPAVMSGNLVGLIAAANSDNLYSERDLEAVEGLAALYAVAVDRMRAEENLRDLSLEDELTKLYNRRGFMALAEQQFKVAHRSKKEMFLLYADLDDLKRVNDTFGHEEGDVALVETAAILREAFRESDIIARIGGDEFVVLAVDAGEDKVQAIEQRLKDKFVAWNALTARRYPLSVSLGCAYYDPKKPCTIQELVALADKAMYGDKAATKGAAAPGA